VPPLCQATKLGLAPSAALNKLGFEPVDMVCRVQFSFAVSSHWFYQLPYTLSPTPGPSHTPPGILTALNSANSSGVVVSEKGSQESVVGRVPDSVMAILSEGFDEIDKMFSQIASRMKMPFHQVFAHYMRLQSHATAVNLWNTYSKYFVKNMEQELAHLPKGERVTGTPSTNIHRCCFALFKEEYKDMYPMVLETWMEANELEHMGGTLACRQQLFDKSKKSLNHTVCCLVIYCMDMDEL